MSKYNEHIKKYYLFFKSVLFEKTKTSKDFNEMLTT